MNARLEPLAVGIVVAIVVLFVTSPAADREFSLDDIPHLAQFPSQNRAHSPAEIARLRHWQNQTEDSVWRPIPKVLWAGLNRIGLCAPPTLTCITALLAGCCAAAFFVCWHGTIANPVLLALVATVPVLTPLSADVLLPLVGQSDLLAAVGVLGAFAWLQFRGVACLACAGVFLLFAFLSKESSWPAVIALPLVIWLGPGSSRFRRHKALTALLLGGGIMAVVLVTRFALFGNFTSTAGAAGSAAMAAGERSIGTLESVGRYSAAMLLPFIPQTDYSFLKQPGGSSGSYPYCGMAALLCLGTLMSICARRTRATRANAARLRASRRALGAACWIILFLFPYLGFIPLGALWAGRFAFLAMFGIPILLLSLAGLLPTILRPIVPAYLCIIIVFGIFAIHRRAYDWVSPVALWNAEIRRQPNHAFAWKNHAVYLQRDGKLEEAFASASTATKLWPTFGEGWLAKGQIAWAAGKHSEADSAFNKAERLIPGNSTLELARAQFCESRGNLDQAEQRLHALLTHDPANTEARKSLERVLRKKQ